MKRLSAVFVLTTLGAATVALAQLPTPRPPAQPPASTSSQEQSPATPPADPSTSSTADKQAQMKDCTTQIKSRQSGSTRQSHQRLLRQADQQTRAAAVTAVLAIPHGGRTAFAVSGSAAPIDHGITAA